MGRGPLPGCGLLATVPREWLASARARAHVRVHTHPCSGASLVTSLVLALASCRF